MSITRERLTELMTNAEMNGGQHGKREKIVLLTDEMRVILRELLARREAERWRDAKTEPPTEQGEYLVMLLSGRIRQDYFWIESVGQGVMYWDANNGVTHWRPIPPAPEIGGGE
jgi:hypothetical protein